MKINNIKINNFGKLHNKEIKFKDNINIIYGKNESGKSTLLKFIVSMLYGISKNKNGKNITDFDKYTPWHEGDFSGKIKYELDNKEKIEVFREFKRKNPKIFNSESVDISKNFTIDKTKGNRFFYEQTGVDEELFVATIVSEQNKIELDEKDRQNLVQKVANLIGTGEDNTSYKKVIAKLNKKQLEEIGTEKSQDRPINVIRREIEQLTNEIDKLEEISKLKYDLKERKKDILSEIDKRQIKLEALKEIKVLKDKQELQKEKLNLNSRFIKEYDEKIEQIEKKKENRKGKQSEVKKYSKLPIVITFIVSIFSLALGIIIKNIILLGLGIITIIAAGVLLGVKQTKYTKNKGNEEKQKQDEIMVFEEQIQMIKENKEEKEAEYSNLENKIKTNFEVEEDRIKNKYINKLNNIKELLKKDNIYYEIDYIQNYINNKKLELRELEIEEKQNTIELEKLANLKEKIEEKQEKYEYLKNEFECIELAKQTMGEAYEIMKKDVTPKFTENLSKNISKISNGKYTNVKLNEENDIIVEIENGNYVQAENLSTGTIQQIYLSLRLAIIDDLSKENLPIILDEAFVYFDAERLTETLKFFVNSFKDRQIIIFTCTNREEDILKENNINYNLIEL